MAAWGRILTGSVPMLSIEITRECPLSCPGCYAYGDTHLSGGVKLSELSDSRGDALVEGVIDLVRKHKPLHVSLVGGEPMIRHRELSQILPRLSEMGVFEPSARARRDFSGWPAGTSRHSTETGDV